MTDISQSISLLIGKFQSWWNSIVLSVPNLILLVITLLVGLRLIRWAKKLIKRYSEKISQDAAIRDLIVNVAGILLYIGLGVLLLAILGLHKTIAGILASAGVAGLAVGLALQDPLMNLFSGVIMSSRSTLSIGDFIESNGYVGAVQSISLSTTTLRMLTGEEVTIPNKSLLQNPIKNFSTNGLRRIDLVCGVSYGEDLRAVKKIATESVIDIAYPEVARPVEFIYTDFGDSSINFQLRIWTNPPDVWTFLNTKSEVIMKLKAAFDQNDIMIPFPIRTLDFGIKGGETLKSMLGNDNS